MGELSDRGDRRFEHSTEQTVPAGVHDCPHLSGDNRYRSTVSSDNAQRDARRAGDGRICSGARQPVDLVGTGDDRQPRPVHLAEPDDGSWAEDRSTTLRHADAGRPEITSATVGESDGPPVYVERRDGQ